MPPKSKISQLPPELRAEIDALLIARGFAGYEQLERDILDAHGIELGKSTLHRYGQKLEQKLSAIRASTEAARLIAEAAPDDTDQRSAAVISLVQSELFQAMVDLQEAEQEEDPGERIKLLSGAARAIAEASRASLGQKKYAAEIQAAAKREAADAAEKVARRGGLSPDAVQELRRAILGVRE